MEGDKFLGGREKSSFSLHASLLFFNTIGDTIGLNNLLNFTTMLFYTIPAPQSCYQNENTAFLYFHLYTQPSFGQYHIWPK